MVGLDLMDRASEVAKYEAAYQDQNYALGQRRRDHILRHLERIERGSLLDVSTGRGEVLHMAESLGHGPVQGTEAVAYLCGPKVTHALAHDLPFCDGQFDTVCMFDVMEHLLPRHCGKVCKPCGHEIRVRVQQLQPVAATLHQTGSAS